MITWYLPPPGADPWTWPWGPAELAEVAAVTRYGYDVGELAVLVGQLAVEADAGAALAERLAGSLPGP